MQTLLLFDIGNDKLRNKITYLLEEVGTSHIQFSVFMGDLDEYEKELLIEKLQETIRDYLSNEQPNDQNRQLIIHIIPLCHADANKIKIINRNGLNYYTPISNPNLIIV
ncbi:MAG: CRISPR-associated endonuclease Cas2 [Candidatus Hydrogenedens sp.]